MKTNEQKDKESFDAWWHNEGSGIKPGEQEDIEEFAKDIALIAWLNGAFKAREIETYKNYMERAKMEK